MKRTIATSWSWTTSLLLGLFSKAKREGLPALGVRDHPLHVEAPTPCVLASVLERLRGQALGPALEQRRTIRGLQVGLERPVWWKAKNVKLGAAALRACLDRVDPDARRQAAASCARLLEADNVRSALGLTSKDALWDELASIPSSRARASDVLLRAADLLDAERDRALRALLADTELQALLQQQLVAQLVHLGTVHDEDALRLTYATLTQLRDDLHQLPTKWQPALRESLNELEGNRAQLDQALTTLRSMDEGLRASVGPLHEELAEVRRLLDPVRAPGPLDPEITRHLVAHMERGRLQRFLDDAERALGENESSALPQEDLEAMGQVAFGLRPKLAGAAFERAARGEQHEARVRLLYAFRARDYEDAFEVYQRAIEADAKQALFDPEDYSAKRVFKVLNEWSCRTHPVAQKKPNAWGLYDMHGNVWEWCRDAWSPTYQGAPRDGSARESAGTSDRVLRGGSCSLSASTCWSSNRFRQHAGVMDSTLGFRPAKSYR